MADSWKWPGLDHAGAARLLRPHRPGTGLVPIGEGDFCLAFRQDYQVVRVARHAAAAQALRREACVLGAIADALPLPVPRPVYHDPGTCPPFAVHDAIVGEVLTRDIWLGMPTDVRQNAALDLATFLRALHSLPVAVGLECGLAPLDAVRFARTLCEDSVALDALLDTESAGRLNALLARWSEPSSGSAPPQVLLHCDIGPGHLLYDPASGRLTGVIDFGDIAMGEPARDFIYIYEDYGPAILNDVLSWYAGEDAASQLAGIRKWYLLEAVSWTLEKHAAGRASDAAQGLAEIARELQINAF